MHTHTNFYLLSLAFSDLVVLTFGTFLHFFPFNLFFVFSRAHSKLRTD
ncbi:unnamed protein product [Angiostrongylus costaricensis]|uniref:G_PROTEIN_RECEP_F1_2 domain-containing protein n=1 Tax=Angiostrongylus costaricensis TaxID=334426 RepID=A0A0R3PNE9_ANGCS|nr:unnamed protein product [Angiostrongylus costaricensis]